MGEANPDHNDLEEKGKNKIAEDAENETVTQEDNQNNDKNDLVENSQIEGQTPDIDQNEDLEAEIMDFADLDDIGSDEMADLREAVADNLRETGMSEEDVEKQLADQEKSMDTSQAKDGSDEIDKVEGADLDFNVDESVASEIESELSESSGKVEGGETGENEVSGGEGIEEKKKEDFNPEISAELEAKMQAELADREEEKEEVTTKREFINYLSSRRSKIQYHALWHLVFDVEDHASTKKGLYDALKGVTSKDPVEPLEEHKFYFGLGFILRLELMGKKVVTFKDGKLTIATGIENLKKILNVIGDPISERPIITNKEKTDMYKEFLKDDFLNEF